MFNPWQNLLPMLFGGNQRAPNSNNMQFNPRFQAFLPNRSSLHTPLPLQQTSQMQQFPTNTFNQYSSATYIQPLRQLRPQTSLNPAFHATTQSSTTITSSAPPPPPPPPPPPSQSTPQPVSWVFVCKYTISRPQ